MNYINRVDRFISVIDCRIVCFRTPEKVGRRNVIKCSSLMLHIECNVCEYGSWLVKIDTYDCKQLALCCREAIGNISVNCR